MLGDTRKIIIDVYECGRGKNPGVSKPPEKKVIKLQSAYVLH